MAFDFFTQPTGPKIDISLFPDAVNSGIQAGNAQKTVAQNIVSGIGAGIELYQQYQKTEDNALSLQIKQNQVDQIPVQNKIQESQALTQEATATIQQAKAREQIANEAVTTQEQASIAQAKTAEAEVAAQEAASQKQFNDTIKSTDATTFRKQFEAGQYNSLVSNPKAFDTAIKYAFMDPTLDAAGRDRLSFAYKGHAIDVENQRKAQEDAAKFSALSAQIEGDGMTMALADKLKMTPLDVPTNVVSYPAGTWKVDPNTNQIMKDGQGNRIPTDAAYRSAHPTAKDQVDYFSKDDTLLQASVPAKYDNDLKTWRGLNDRANGTYAARQKALLLQGQNAVKGGPTQVQDDGVAGPPAKPVSFTESLASRIPYLGGTEISSDLQKAATQHEKFLQTYVANPELRGSPQFITQRNIQLESIAKDLSDKEFDGSPALQAQYTEEKLKKDAALERINLANKFGAGVSYMPEYMSLVKDFIPESPKDAYYQNRRPILMGTLIDASNDYLVKAFKIVSTPADKRKTATTLTALTRSARGG